MLMNFVKMHGLGNDYVYFDCVDASFGLEPAAAARALSDRHFGIGGDGIVLIERAQEAPFRMRMFNADGSEAEMCGNAIRCVGKLLRDRGHAAGDEVKIVTGAGVLTLKLMIGNDGLVSAARVDMGSAILAGREIPVDSDLNPVVREAIQTKDGTTFEVTCVSMGNPHAVIFVDEITDELVLGYGPELEVHPFFPNRVNVEFVKVKSRAHLNMRVWERGSGETMACGTGACGVLVAAVLNDLADRSATVSLPGGDLLIEWPENGNVFMTGPATLAFEGTIDPAAYGLA
jgi:diaminopimelate epimerase